VKALIEGLLEHFPELRDDEQLRADTFEGADIDWIFSKLISDIREAESMQEAIDLRQDDLNARCARYERKEKLLRVLLEELMEVAGLTKKVLPEGTISISQRAPALIVIDEKLLPEEAFATKKTVSMQKIRELAKTGVVPGTMLDNGKTVLTIKTQ